MYRHLRICGYTCFAAILGVTVFFSLSYALRRSPALRAAGYSESEIPGEPVLATDRVRDSSAETGDTSANNTIDEATDSFEGKSRKRISEHIKILNAESVRESVSNLSQVGMFYWPGIMNDSIRGISDFPFPLSLEEGTIDVDRILSNRRFLKCVSELKALSKTEAGRIVGEQLEMALQQYAPIFEDRWTESRDHFADSSAVPGESPSGDAFSTCSFQMSDNEDGSPTFLGLRLQILSLVLIAGNLGLEEARAPVQIIVEEAYRQRDRLYQPDEREGATSHNYVWLCSASLYNRQVLATGLLGTEAGRLAAGASPSGAAFETHRMTRYDAEFTPYDILTRYDGSCRPDYSKGEIVVNSHRALDDAAFDKIWRDTGHP